MGSIDNFSSVSEVKTATIANGASLSGAINCGNGTAKVLQAPADQEGTIYTFQSSLDGVTYGNLYDETGTEYQVTMASSRVIFLDPKVFYGLQYLKIRTGTAASASAQTGAAAIKVKVVGL